MTHSVNLITLEICINSFLCMQFVFYVLSFLYLTYASNRISFLTVTCYHAILFFNSSQGNMDARFLSKHLSRTYTKIFLILIISRNYRNRDEYLHHFEIYILKYIAKTYILTKRNFISRRFRIVRLKIAYSNESQK